VDTGHGRTGIPAGDTESLVATARAVAASRHLKLEGLLTHGGDTYQASDPAIVIQRFNRSRQQMQTAADALRREYPDLLVSVGDTPGCCVAENFAGIDEIRPGNFVFFDVMQQQRGVCSSEDIAIALVCPVVAIHERRNEVVLYGGAVHLSRESLGERDGTQIFGRIVLPGAHGWSAPIPGAAVVRLSQEHGIVRLPAEQLRGIEEGDLLGVLPVHSCLTAECMKGYRCLDGSAADHLAGCPDTPLPATTPTAS
ncbi:MAG: alanine racemase, partial [Bacteroidetes bacterium]|nr:alanine racemase [Bacteroidota bacterium]